MKKKLSISLLWKISVVVIAALFTLSYFSIEEAKKHSRETFIHDTAETVDTMLTFVGNTNSVMMQQLRSYTMLDNIGLESSDPEEVQQMLVSKAKRRYKWFSRIAYVQYSSGIAFNDDGTTQDVSSTPWFKTMKQQRKPKKGLQTYADVVRDETGKIVYPICKDAEPKDDDGYCLGFFVGYVPINYMQYYFNKIKGNEINSPEGFPLLLNKNFDIICAPDETYVMSVKFQESDEHFEHIDNQISEFVANPLEKDENGNLVTVTGKITLNEVPSTIIIGKLAGTQWTLAIATPDASIDESATLLTKTLFIGAVLAVVVIIFVMILLFQLSFRPLAKLNEAFKNIASGDADLTSRLKEGKNDEIGQICRSFNAYVTGMQEMIRDIGKAREDLTVVESTLDITTKKIEKGLQNVADSSAVIKAEAAMENNYAGSLENFVKSTMTSTAEINKILVSQHTLTKQIQSAKPEDLQKILVGLTANLKKINDILKQIFGNGKTNLDVSGKLRKAARNANTAAEQLDKNSSEIEETKEELEDMLKTSYNAINLISERVEGFQY